jgi:prepilin-type processing-associated H-X9-DG protein
MQNYANEFKGRVPRDYWYGQQYKEGHILWAEAFAKYVGYNDMPHIPTIDPPRDAILAPHLARIEVYQCPAFPNEQSALDYVSNAWYAGVVGVSAPLINVVRMPQSGKTVYLTEGSGNLRPDYFGIHDVFDVAHLPVTPTRIPQPTSSRMLTDNRHGGRINLLYLDGHVASTHFKDVGRKDFDFLYNR